ncbi:MAG: tungstate ABC transporter substrate-binding protein WtpA [Bacteroidales bacterium]|jgi:molybdate/tungstate transport system substrate-binding protein|nr:tungstate ABC transporter substrate-binding protein WtpA [Bacteroidales bacterium]
MYKKLLISSIVGIMMTSTVFAQQKSKGLKGDLIIFHAGSLSVPMKEVAAAFNKIYPNVRIQMESAGSIASARKITDLNRPCDILASSDYAVIDNMLIPKYADWNIRFVSNELSIVYHEKSRYANNINNKNWFEILMKPDVAFSRADPNADPCGYRSILSLLLAEKYYKKPGLAKRIMEKDLNYMRPKEVDLVALLESGSIDYIFLYRSVALQHKLKYLILPDEVNLKTLVFADLYASVSTEINGKEPGKKEVVKGEPMIYGITILRDAPNREAAIAFTKFLLTREKGMAIMEKNGQPSVIPLPTMNYDKLPIELKSFAKKQ